MSLNKNLIQNYIFKNSMETQTLTKICNTCSIEKHISEYTNNIKYKLGKENKCKECVKEANKANKEKIAESQRRWRKNNPDYMNEYQKTEKSQQYIKSYYKEHCEKYKARKKEWRQKNPEKEKEARKKYAFENKEKLNQYHSKWKANKRIIDVNYKLKENISRRIRYELNSLLKGKKTKRTLEYIGCSIEDLKEHLNKQLSTEMNWDNYGIVWHIDHILPCACWNLQDEFENMCCWNFRNLQPLLASINQSKSDNHSPEIKAVYINEMKEILKISET